MNGWNVFSWATSVNSTRHGVGLLVEVVAAVGEMVGVEVEVVVAE